MDAKRLYEAILENLDSLNLTHSEIKNPDPTIETEVTGIYTQARKHRGNLVTFYIWYTILFTAYVLILIGVQAKIRTDPNEASFEIMPQWSLNLLVTGMFAQFIGLLKVVTERVWDFRALFTHHTHMKSANIVNKTEGDDDK